MGVQGVGHMEDEAEPNPIGPTPWCLFGFFLGIQKEAHRPQAVKTYVSGQIKSDAWR